MGVVKFGDVEYTTVKYGDVETKRTKSLLGLDLNKYNVPTYNYKEIDDFIHNLGEDYECINVNEGTLGSGDWICIPSEDNKPIFVIRERFESSWSSVHTIEETNELTDELSKEIDDFYNSLDNEDIII